MRIRLVTITVICMARKKGVGTPPWTDRQPEIAVSV
jgi:hypothetical protein